MGVSGVAIAIRWPAGRLDGHLMQEHGRFGPSSIVTVRRSRTLSAEQEVHQPHQGIVVRVGDALFERYVGIVRYRDLFGTDVGASGGDVAEVKPRLLLDDLDSICGVHRVHLEACQPSHESGPIERVLAVMVA